MPILAWIPCPHCRFPNIPEERYCKRCHKSMAEVFDPTPIEAVTTETITLYHDHEAGQMLVISARWFEYAEPQLVVRTPWTNLTSIHLELWEYYLYLLHDPILVRAGNGYRRPPPTIATEATTYPKRRINLNGFGFPTNSALSADLRRYAPQLTRDIP